MYLYSSYLRLRGSHRDCLLQEHGFTIGRGRPRSPSIEPDYDEDDDAWMASIVEESKVSLFDISAVTSKETNQRVALSGEASGSNAGTTDAPEGEASGSNANAPGAPQDDRRSTMSTSTPMEVEIIPDCNSAGSE